MANELFNFTQPQQQQSSLSDFMSLFGGGNNMFGNAGAGGNVLKNTFAGSNLFDFGGENSPFGGQFDGLDLMKDDTSQNDIFGNKMDLKVDPEIGGSDLMKKFGIGVDAFKNAFGLYAGMRGLGYMGDKIDIMKTNQSNQAKLTNERLRTRQAARLRGRGIVGEANDKAVAEFMAQNAVSGG